MTITHTPPPTGQKLAVGEIFYDTFGTCWDLVGALPGVALWPLLIGIVATGVGLIPIMYPGFPAGSIVFSLFSYLVLGVSYTLFAVAWHRLVLLNSTFESSAPTAWFRNHTRFYGYLILVYVMLAGLMVPPFIAMGMLFAPTNAGAPDLAPDTLGWIFPVVLVVFAVYFLFYYLFYRVSFVFPATAVGETYRLADSWRNTRGNGWRLIAISLLVNIVTGIVLLPLTLIAVAIVHGLVLAPDAQNVSDLIVAAVAVSPIQVVAEFIFLALNVTLISLSFRAATGWVPGPMPPAAPVVPGPDGNESP